MPDHVDSRTNATHEARPLVFRTRAVVWSGIADLGLGLLVVAGGSALAVLGSGRAGLPMGIAIILIGLTIATAGVGRAASRLEVYSNKVAWTWWFSRHQVALEDLESAALVEPGAPDAGDEWSAFIPGSVWGIFPLGGLLAVAAWWIYGLVLSMMRAEPTLGSHALFLVRRYGPPERVEPIGSFAFSTTGTTASAAQRAIQLAIDHLHRASSPEQPSQLRPPIPPLRA